MAQLLTGPDFFVAKLDTSGGKKPISYRFPSAKFTLSPTTPFPDTDK